MIRKHVSEFIESAAYPAKLALRMTVYVLIWAAAYSLLTTCASLTVSTAEAAEPVDDIAEAMPGTQITSTTPTVIEGLYEVVAGENVLYVDSSGRYLVVGSIYDLKEDRDLSAERRAEVVQDTAAVGEAKKVTAVTQAVTVPSPASTAEALAGIVDAETGAAITTGEGARSLTVLTDPTCGWCRRMWVESLHDLEGTRVNHLLLHRNEQAVGILCAEHPGQALRRAFDVAATTAKTPVPSTACRRDAVDKIDRVVRFAQGVGWLATPVLIREDGEIHAGYLGRSDLLNWLGDNTDES